MDKIEKIIRDLLYEIKECDRNLDTARDLGMNERFRALINRQRGLIRALELVRIQQDD